MDGVKGKKDKVFIAIGDLSSQEAYLTSRQSPNISKPPISTAPADSSTGRASPVESPRSGALTQTRAVSLSSLDDSKGRDSPLVPSPFTAVRSRAGACEPEDLEWEDNWERHIGY